MIVYKITNLINNKVYIGQTVQKPYRRWKRHKQNCRLTNLTYPLYNSMRKHGIENFTFDVILECETLEELNKMEKLAIINFDSTNPEKGYNISLGGNNKGKHSEETKRKISQSQVGSKNHMFGRKGSLSPLFGKKLSEERKLLMSIYRKGKPSPNKGKKLNQETKEKIKKANIGKKLSKETKLKISESLKGKKHYNYGKNRSKEILLKYSKFYKITFPDGTEQVIQNLAEFCRNNNLSASNMNAIANGRGRTHKRFLCNYVDMKNLEGELQK